MAIATVADPMLTYTFKINRVIKDTMDTFSMELTPLNGEFTFKPGQFNMLYVYGVGEVPISISGDSAQSHRLVHTTREVGTVTRAMRRLKAGDTIGVRGPYGTHWPIEKYEGNDIVLITGGIGLAPLRPVIYHVLANRDKYGKFVLLYGARTPEDILYAKDLEKLRSRFDLDILITVDRATGAWRGNVGVVTQLVGHAPFDPMHCTAMICGPEIMMRFSIMELQKRGVADDSMYVSMERNMKCGIGLCGHCQLGGHFVCKDGPVYRYDEIRDIFSKREM
ncbi:MAG: FAD/NAD(P)-binding protein [candidate division Zixibacteria bacterium]|nr:FAD/NAD(P)-binding protein [candidate division Zixibacteria bacterium]